MTPAIPSYLRLHQAPKEDSFVQPLFSLDPLDRFWQAYTDATGWRVDQNHAREKVSAARASRGTDSESDLRVLPAVNLEILGDAESANDQPSVTQSAAEQLARAAKELSARFERAQEAFRTQEAELAATATPIGTDDRPSFTRVRLEKILRIAMSATGCVAAGIYLLDNDTTNLKLRISQGLPIDRLLAPPRPLRGSRADLESLVQDVVLIDDLAGALATTWNSPEEFAAAIVVKIEEDDLPIGTLWLWAAEPTEFSAQQGAAAQIAAMAISTELARASLQRERSQSKLTTQSIKSATQWQLRQLPAAAEIAPGIKVDGWTESPTAWATSWHAWDVLPDGTIAIALAEAASKEFEGAMIAATARAAFAAHCNYRHSVSDMLRRINDTLWQTNTGDQLLAMQYIKFDPDTGAGELATAGRLASLVASTRGYRPLTMGDECDWLGSQIDFRPHTMHFQLSQGEALLCVNQSVMCETNGLSQTELGSLCRKAMSGSKRSILPAIRRVLASTPLEVERAGFTLWRQT